MKFRYCFIGRIYRSRIDSSPVNRYSWYGISNSTMSHVVPVPQLYPQTLVGTMHATCPFVR